MWLMSALLTGSALCVVACVLFAQRAAASRDEAARSEANLRLQLGRIVALEGGLENLLGQHRKLAGRIYADEYHEERRQIATVSAAKGEPCANWRTRDFPEGDDCEFCAAMRAERASARERAKSKLTPLRSA